MAATQVCIGEVLIQKAGDVSNYQSDTEKTDMNSNLQETVQRTDNLIATLRSESSRLRDKKSKAFLDDFIKGAIEALRIAKMKNKIKQ